ncbi:4'-phosphopantetheinyl transferase family protein [Streptomyces sp. NPDC007088]|uniref:4'-phosphopantetheinyl transferase family protein n=1 Tax=Streptomyces sp. NPDC007088 TaxID=3364773 RepID=UPI00367A3514
MLRTPGAWDLLHPEELATAAAMAAWRAEEHLAGRALLRLLTAELLGNTAAQRKLVVEPNGRPRLPHTPPYGVSISHSGPYVAAAVAENREVGVDIQTPRSPSPGMLRRCCVPKTAAWLATLPPEMAAHAFAQVWTVQEACVKAHGTGLSGSPWKVPVSPESTAGTWQLLRWNRAPWPAEAGETAALACAIGPPAPDRSSPTPPLENHHAR